MEDMAIQDKPGLVRKIANIFVSHEDQDELEQVRVNDLAHPGLQLKANYRYTVTVRRQITSFDDAMAAANGLKRGEQQILNLCATDATTRQKIVDFMCGVNFSQEGTWEEIGENIYLIVPSNAYVEVAPPTPRMQSVRN
jgi:cell division inhibitor SepF